jgi:hypothetical protein
MSAPKTIEQKVGEWQRAYFAVVTEVFPLDYLNRMKESGFSVESRLAYEMQANRTAAIVAAMLVGQNVRIPPTELDEDRVIGEERD